MQRSNGLSALYKETTSEALLFQKSDFPPDKDKIPQRSPMMMIRNKHTRSLCVLFVTLLLLPLGCRKKQKPPSTKAHTKQEGNILDAFYRGKDRHLPISTTAKHLFQHSTLLGITKKAILVNRKKACDVFDGGVDSSLKKDKQASSYMIMPLYMRLREAMERRKKLAQYNKAHKFRGLLTMLLDRDIPFRLLSEAMYTAGQAEFGTFHLAACTNTDPTSKTCDVRIIRIYAPHFGSTTTPDGKTDICHRPHKQMALLGALGRHAHVKDILSNKNGLKALDAALKHAKGVAVVGAPKAQKGKYHKQKRHTKPKPHKKQELRKKRDQPTPHMRAAAPRLNLTVAITSKGVTLLSRGRRLGKGCDLNAYSLVGPTFPKKGKHYDHKGLSTCISKIKKLFPNHHHIIYMAEPEVSLGTLVKTMDAVRGSPKNPRFPCATLSAVF